MGTPRAPSERRPLTRSLPGCGLPGCGLPGCGSGPFQSRRPEQLAPPPARPAHFPQRRSNGLPGIFNSGAGPVILRFPIPGRGPAGLGHDPGGGVAGSSHGLLRRRAPGPGHAGEHRVARYLVGSCGEPAAAAVIRRRPAAGGAGRIGGVRVLTGRSPSGAARPALPGGLSRCRRSSQPNPRAYSASTARARLPLR